MTRRVVSGQSRQCIYSDFRPETTVLVTLYFIFYLIIKGRKYVPQVLRVHSKNLYSKWTNFYKMDCLSKGKLQLDIVAFIATLW